MTKNRKGSLLVEVLLSVVILSVSITVIIQAMTVSLRSMVYSADYTTAMIVLENKMVSVIDKPLGDENAAQALNLEPPSSWRYSIDLHPATDHNSSSQLEEVNSKVEWDKKGKHHQLSLATYQLQPSQ